MVMSTQEGGSGSGSGSGVGTESINERMWEFISSEITRDILEWTPVLFGLVKEGISVLLDGCLVAFQNNIIVVQLGAHLSSKLVEL